MRTLRSNASPPEPRASERSQARFASGALEMAEADSRAEALGAIDGDEPSLNRSRRRRRRDPVLPDGEAGRALIAHRLRAGAADRTAPHAPALDAARVEQHQLDRVGRISRDTGEGPRFPLRDRRRRATGSGPKSKTTFRTAASSRVARPLDRVGDLEEGSPRSRRGWRRGRLRAGADMVSAPSGLAARLQPGGGGRRLRKTSVLSPSLTGSATEADAARRAFDRQGESADLRRLAERQDIAGARSSGV